MVSTGNGELGFYSGEGAWETATTSKEGSRRANYPIPTRGGSDNKYWYRWFYASCNWNEYNLNLLTRNNWRASLVPAAAVIPAPIAYIKVVAVKKLVVEPWTWPTGLPHRMHWSGWVFPSGKLHALYWVCCWTRTFTLKKLECSKQALARIH